MELTDARFGTEESPAFPTRISTLFETEESRENDDEPESDVDIFED